MTSGRLTGRLPGRSAGRGAPGVTRSTSYGCAWMSPWPTCPASARHRPLDRCRAMARAGGWGARSGCRQRDVRLPRARACRCLGSATGSLEWMGLPAASPDGGPLASSMGVARLRWQVASCVTAGDVTCPTRRTMPTITGAGSTAPGQNWQTYNNRLWWAVSERRRDDDEHCPRGSRRW
jgi:hypothetical protein